MRLRKLSDEPHFLRRYQRNRFQWNVLSVLGSRLSRSAHLPLNSLEWVVRATRPHRSATRRLRGLSRTPRAERTELKVPRGTHENSRNRLANSRLVSHGKSFSSVGRDAAANLVAGMKWLFPLQSPPQTLRPSLSGRYKSLVIAHIRKRRTRRTKSAKPLTRWPLRLLRGLTKCEPCGRDQSFDPFRSFRAERLKARRRPTDHGCCARQQLLTAGNRNPEIGL
jgi:hypothetical protein